MILWGRLQINHCTPGCTLILLLRSSQNGSWMQDLVQEHMNQIWLWLQRIKLILIFSEGLQPKNYIQRAFREVIRVWRHTLGHRGTNSERLNMLHGLSVRLCGCVIRSTFICKTLWQYRQFFQPDLNFVEMRMLLPPFPIYLCFTHCSMTCFWALNLIVTPADPGY